MGIKPGSEVEALLAVLCVQYGYCLPTDKSNAIIANPPADAESFVDAVLTAEGLELDSFPKSDRAVLNQLVERRLFSE